jgi:hypothetical protein
MTTTTSTSTDRSTGDPVPDAAAERWLGDPSPESSTDPPRRAQSLAGIAAAGVVVVASMFGMTNLKTGTATDARGGGGFGVPQNGGPGGFGAGQAPGRTAAGGAPSAAAATGTATRRTS